MLPSAEQVNQSLERIRPYLRADGGDVDLVRITGDGIVEVRFTGSCVSCPLSAMTLRAGVERAILYQFTDIRRVEQVR